MRRKLSLQFMLAASCALLLAPSARGQSPLQITPPPPLSDGTVTRSYFAGFGTNYPANDAYSWALVAGSLPPGLSLNAATPASPYINGTATATGTYSFRLQVIDSTASQTAVQDYSITIVPVLLITTKLTLPDATQGGNYFVPLQATGGTPPYTWTLGIASFFGSAGAASIPRPGGVIKLASRVQPSIANQRSASLGLIIDSSANLTGSPNQAGTFSFYISVVDSSANNQQGDLQLFALTVNGPPTILTPSMLPTGSVGSAYIFPLSAQGGTPPLTWNVLSGSLPPGLSLTSPGFLAGLPTAAGLYTFSASVADVWGAAATMLFAITIAPGFTISTPSLPNGTAGQPYSAQLKATGGKLPYVWQIASGSLPTGVTLDSATGLISGTPQFPGTTRLVIQASDSTQAFAKQAFSLTIAPGGLTFVTETLPNGAVAEAYQQTVAGAGGTPPFAFTVSAGALPNGLKLDPATGVLSGTPSTAGSFNFTVQLADAAKASVTHGLAVTINPPLAIDTTALADGKVGAAYSQQVKVSGGTTPYKFAAVGALPAGLALDPATGVISGTATTSGPASLTVQVTDAGQVVVSHKYNLNLATSLAFLTPSPLPNAPAGKAYTLFINVSGGTAPLTFSIVAGALPAGLSLDSAKGTLSGTPTATGTFHFTVQVTDSAQATLPQAYDLTVTAPALSKPDISGVTDTEPPAQQPALGLKLADPYPLPLDGTMALAFDPVPAGADDPAVQFSTGGRDTIFTIPAGSTDAVFPNNQISLSTGTVAGKITLTLHFKAGDADVTPDPAPTRVIDIPAAAPVISKVVATRTSTGIQVQVTGFSNSRDMTSAKFDFQASGGTLATSSFTIPADQLFSAWYSSSSSLQYGSQFTFAQPFAIPSNATSVTSVAVTLTNKQGASTAVSATVQ